MDDFPRRQQKLSNEKKNVHLVQCLEISRDIIKIGQQFSITIKIGNGFNFDVRNIKEEEELQKATIIVAVSSLYLLLCGPLVSDNKDIVALYNMSILHWGSVKKKRGKLSTFGG